MVNFIISKVEFQQFVMSEKQFCHHHRTISLYLIKVQVQVL